MKGISWFLLLIASLLSNTAFSQKPSDHTPRFPTQNAASEIYLGSREGDPASIVENVSTIHGDYTEVEVDVTVASPDSLVLSRLYSSRDPLQIASFGGWRFNPHCFLTMQKDPKGKTYSSAKGKFERTYAYVGNPDGSILTYVGWKNVSDPTKLDIFKIDPDEETIGLANTAKGSISCWTNLKNNELYYNAQTDSFELFLSSEGKRFYAKHPSLDCYCITHEVLPSGNKIFYEFDEKGRLTLIKGTNASQKKILAWIKIQYSNGIHIETSDGKTAGYQFQQDSSGFPLLTSVIRSDKPALHYQYQIADNRALLVKKTLPEGRFVHVDYYTGKDNNHKVRSITTPSNPGETTTTEFTYGDGQTEVNGPGNRQAIYRFDENLQLIAIEQYLDGSLYRTHKKSWGRKSDAGNLISTSVEDAHGNVFYYKYFVYDSKNNGNIVQERKYGDVAGTGAVPLIIDDNGSVANQDGHLKTYSYFSGKDTYGFFQGDPEGSGVKYWYKKGTNLLLKKHIFCREFLDSEGEPYDPNTKQRHFYTYNEDAAITCVVIDDGVEASSKDISGITQRLVTHISPKQELPNVGAPEVVEQRYLSLKSKSECLLKRTVNQFDLQGNVVSQAVYDANEKYQFSVTKGYAGSLLIFETDPMGSETHYFYDANQNLILVSHSNTGISAEYEYDLKNRLIHTIETDRLGNRFETQVAYDPAGYKLAEMDRFGNETLYVNDALGRPISITYPETGGPDTSIKPTYMYVYDLFDNPISVTDPKGRVLAASYTVQGKPAKIKHPDGTKEVFRYDSAGNLHHYYGKDGLGQTFGYDYAGRLNHIGHFERGKNLSAEPFKEESHKYTAFHKTSETDAKSRTTSYTYDDAGRLATLKKGNQKIEFIYDALGRTCGVKKWKSLKDFTLEVKEYDLLDRVIEERTEGSKGNVLAKKRYVYNDAGELAQIIGYPQNKESVLMQYEYDGFGRLSKATNAAHSVTEIFYEDAYVNKWGQKAQKRTLIDPMGVDTEEVFDNEDNLIKVTRKDKSGQILSCVETSYDCSGNKVHEWASVIADNHPSGIYETEWAFNQGDQLQSITLGKGSPEERTTCFEYNSYGDLVAKYGFGSKAPISYQYDASGNLETISYKEGEKEINYTLSFDLNDNLTGIKQDSAFSLSYTFDNNNLLLSETIQDKFGSYQVTRTYDSEGYIQTLQFPDGSFVEYTYEGPFVKSAQRFDKGRKELYNYQVSSKDLMGNLIEEILPGDVGGRKQFWDAAGRRTEITTDFFQDKVLEEGYDPLNNITKREIILDEEKTTVDYDYNTLAQLVAEKGALEHKYAYDSIGNRLQKDDSPYKINALNQLTEAEGTSYTFHLNGNLATKTTNGNIRSYLSNPLNQLISIKDSDQNSTTFTYDPMGKRLSKQVKIKGKKPKTFRFFYLGNTEIGCVDEKGTIIELKVPSDPNNPEAPCIAIELRKETYVPLYDLQGNVACLLDHKKRTVVESYHYSVYGEEEITNERGKTVSDSPVGNPWRYRGKRIDKEVGLIYFGYRYYDPEIGRWVSPDPAGAVDGSNLYVFVHNNPMTYVDYFGLSSTTTENCGCTQHNHPGWHNAPEDCICVCGMDGSGVLGGYRSKRGSDITSALAGISHGVVDFVIASAQDLQTMAVYMGSAELEMSANERIQMIEAVERSQADQMFSLGRRVMGMLSINESDAVYQSFRSKTKIGLEVGSLVIGGYGAVKGVMNFGKLAKATAQISKMAAKNLGKAESLYQGHLLHSHLKQVQKYGSQSYKKLANGRIRYYGDIDLSKTKGEMIGRRLVREWDPQTGLKRSWHETMDQGGNIRIVRPEMNDTNKVHYIFDTNGIFEGIR